MLNFAAHSPELAHYALAQGATRKAAKSYFLTEIRHYFYAGSTALHAPRRPAYQAGIARELIARGANVRARNRRGAEPLHAAAIGAPGEIRMVETALGRRPRRSRS